MGFDTLLGNERLKDNLINSLARGRISHFYLISGPEGSGKHTLALALASAILCRSAGKPCGHCDPCRKVMSGSHPDVITVQDPEHKNVAVKIVRQYREDIFIRPNESDHKIYIFPQDLGIEGQNTLLKILEEPPAYGVFILLTDSPEKLLPTVRSRCTELAMQAIPEKTLRTALVRDFPKATREDIDAAIFRSGGWLGQAKKYLEEGSDLPPQTEEFVKSFAARDALGLTQVLTPMEKWKRDPLCEILAAWSDLLEQALACRSGITAVSAQAKTLSAARSSLELMDAVRTLKKAREYALGNISPAAVCGWLVWELR